ncbi:MAG TPA: hypothetical protein VF487_08670 [Chitinophagaceae bacterium]
MASIFMGIGINNFSALETRRKDEMIIKQKVQNALELLNFVDFKIRQVQQGAAKGNHVQTKENFEELISMIALLRNLLLDEEKFN